MVKPGRPPRSRQKKLAQPGESTYSLLGLPGPGTRTQAKEPPPPPPPPQSPPRQKENEPQLRKWKPRPKPVPVEDIHLHKEGYLQFRIRRGPPPAPIHYDYLVCNTTKNAIKQAATNALTGQSTVEDLLPQELGPVTPVTCCVLKPAGSAQNRCCMACVKGKIKYPPGPLPDLPITYQGKTSCRRPPLHPASSRANIAATAAAAAKIETIPEIEDLNNDNNNNNCINTTNINNNKKSISCCGSDNRRNSRTRNSYALSYSQRRPSDDSLTPSEESRLRIIDNDAEKKAGPHVSFISLSSAPPSMSTSPGPSGSPFRYARRECSCNPPSPYREPTSPVTTPRRTSFYSDYQIPAADRRLSSCATEDLIQTPCHVSALCIDALPVPPSRMSEMLPLSARGRPGLPGIPGMPTAPTRITTSRGACFRSTNQPMASRSSLCANRFSGTPLECYLRRISYPAASHLPGHRPTYPNMNSPRCP